MTSTDTNSTTKCPECWGVPMGSGCYHICPNSDAYYSPEQERADEPFYGDDDVRERYAAELDGLDDYYEDDEDFVPAPPAPPVSVPSLSPVESDDIPF